MNENDFEYLITCSSYNVTCNNVPSACSILMIAMMGRGTIEHNANIQPSTIAHVGYW